MLKMLTKDEYNFIIEFKELLIKYSVLFTLDNKKGIDITVYKGKDEDLDNTFIASIHFENEFDENELSDLLEKNSELRKQLL